MLLAQIPCRRLRAVHRRVDTLRVLYDAGVLQSVKVLFLRFSTSASRLSHSAALLKFHHAGDGRVATGSANATKNGVASRVVGEVIEAGILRAGAIGCLGVDPLEVSEHGFPGSAQAIEIETVKADLRSAGGKLIVICAQPVDELDHRGVAPHPRGKAPEPGERFYCVGVALLAAHIAIHAIGAGPIRLCGNGRKTFFLDEPLGDLGALPIKLVGAVRRRPQQDEARIVDEIHERIIVMSGAVQRMRDCAHRLDRPAISRAAIGLAHYSRRLHGQRSRISAGNTCFTSSISPWLTRCSMTKKTARATTPGSMLSSSLNCSSMRARNCSL